MATHGHSWPRMATHRRFDGSRLAGRDKICALYERSEGSDSMSVLWEALAEDFVYAVTLSRDLTYCAYGGTAKSVVVLDGRTGVQVCRVNHS